MASKLIAPSHEAISAGAQRLWQLAGNPAGRDLEFWLGAKVELELERAATSPAADASPPAQLSPLMSFAALPLSLPVVRAIFPRQKILGSLLRWAPLAMGAFRGIKSVIAAAK